MPHFDDLNVPFLDSQDIDILMHREIHFSGSFPVMLEYYEQEGIGAVPDFPLQRIDRLMQEEQRLGRNLAEALLPSSAHRTIEEAKHIYLRLREVYEYPTVHPLSLAISDLILSEEDVPQEEINALCSYQEAAVAPLVELLKTPQFYDPLYPGYGRAPILAAQCLAKLQDIKAISALFEALGQEHFFTDDAMISALRSFGKDAVDFLLKRLSHKPFSKDNEYAAIALSSFPEEHRIAHASLHLLHDPDVKQIPTLAQYLALGCSALKTTEEKKLFLSLKNLFPLAVQKEMDFIAKHWSS
jgi:hypothetical protein